MLDHNVIYKTKEACKNPHRRSDDNYLPQRAQTARASANIEVTHCDSFLFPCGEKKQDVTRTHDLATQRNPASGGLYI